jgi:hypothetical protein
MPPKAPLVKCHGQFPDLRWALGVRACAAHPVAAGLVMAGSVVAGFG